MRNWIEGIIERIEFSRLFCSHKYATHEFKIGDAGTDMVWLTCVHCGHNYVKLDQEAPIRKAEEDRINILHLKDYERGFEHGALGHEPKINDPFYKQGYDRGNRTRFHATRSMRWKLKLDKAA